MCVYELFWYCPFVKLSSGYRSILGRHIIPQQQLKDLLRWTCQTSSIMLSSARNIHVPNCFVVPFLPVATSSALPSCRSTKVQDPHVTPGFKFHLQPSRSPHSRRLVSIIHLCLSTASSLARCCLVNCMEVWRV